MRNALTSASLPCGVCFIEKREPLVCLFCVVCLCVMTQRLDAGSSALCLNSRSSGLPLHGSLASFGDRVPAAALTVCRSAQTTDAQWENSNGIMYETLLCCPDPISVCTNLIWLTVKRPRRSTEI